MLGLSLEPHGGPPELRTRQMRVIFGRVPENEALPWNRERASTRMRDACDALANFKVNFGTPILPYIYFPSKPCGSSSNSVSTTKLQGRAKMTSFDQTARM